MLAQEPPEALHGGGLNRKAGRFTRAAGRQAPKHTVLFEQALLKVRWKAEGKKEPLLVIEVSADLLVPSLGKRRDR